MSDQQQSPFTAAILGANPEAGTYLFQECERQADGTLLARGRRGMAYRRSGRPGAVDWSIVRKVVEVDVVTVEATGAEEYWFDGPARRPAGWPPGSGSAPVGGDGSKAA